MFESKTILLTSVLALGALHCGGSSNHGSNMPEGSTSGESSTGETTPSEGVGPGDTQGASTTTEQTAGPDTTGSQPFEQNPAGGSSAGSSQTALSDPQIAMVTDRVNTAEIEQARIAQSKSKNEQVRHFAEMMIEHHSRAKNEQQALGLDTAESALSRQLEQKSKMTLETLNAKTGNDFDRAYLQAQVEGHQEALDTIRQLEQSAQNSELRSYLENLTPKVEQHLQQARAAQQALQTKTSRSDATTGMR